MTHENEMEMVAAIARIETKLEAVVALEKRVRVLENKDEQRKGGYATLSLLLTLAGGIGAVIGGVIKAWFIGRE